MDNFQTHGAFSWSELATSDVEGATQFYSELLGWDIEENLTEGFKYNIVKTNGQEIGGIFAKPAEAPVSWWGVTITVNNVDEVAAKAVQLGGGIIVPVSPIPGTGRFCMLRDPQGAMFSVMTYEMESSE